MPRRKQSNEDVDEPTITQRRRRRRNAQLTDTAEEEQSQQQNDIFTEPTPKKRKLEENDEEEQNQRTPKRRRRRTKQQEDVSDIIESASQRSTALLEPINDDEDVYYNRSDDEDIVMNENAPDMNKLNQIQSILEQTPKKKSSTSSMNGINIEYENNETVIQSQQTAEETDLHPVDAPPTPIVSRRNKTRRRAKKQQSEDEEEVELTQIEDQTEDKKGDDDIIIEPAITGEDLDLLESMISSQLVTKADEYSNDINMLQTTVKTQPESETLDTDISTIVLVQSITKFSQAPVISFSETTQIHDIIQSQLVKKVEEHLSDVNNIQATTRNIYENHSELLENIQSLIRAQSSEQYNIQELQAAIRQCLILLPSETDISTIQSIINSIITETPDTSFIHLIQEIIRSALIPEPNISNITVIQSASLKSLSDRVNISPLLPIQAECRTLLNNGHTDITFNSSIALQSLFRTLGIMYEQVSLLPLSASIFGRNIFNQWQLHEATIIPTLISIQTTVREATTHLNHDYIFIQATIRSQLTQPPQFLSVVQTQSVIRSEISVPPNISSIIKVQSLVSLWHVSDTNRTRTAAASYLQKCYRDYIVRRRYIVAKSIERIQRQIRQALVTMPNGVTDEMQKNHEELIEDKETIISSIGSSIARGFNKIWSSITGMATPSKKRTRYELEEINSPSPAKRRRLNEQYERRLNELDVTGSIDRVRELELERIKIDNEVLKIIYEERKRQQEPPSVTTPKKTKEDHSNNMFSLTPKDKSSRQVSASVFDNPFSLSSPYGQRTRVSIRTVPVTNRLSLSDTNSIYPSTEQTSIDSTTSLKRTRNEFEDDQLELDNEFSPTTKRSRTDLQSPNTNDSNGIGLFKKTRRRVSWTDGYDRDDPPVRDNGTPIMAQYKHKYQPQQIDQTDVMPILKAPTAPETLTNKRPPAFPIARTFSFASSPVFKQMNATSNSNSYI
jgi:hypothetical protein